MKRLSLLLLAALLAACASPPQPPACQGEFRPVSQPAAKLRISALCGGGHHGQA